jgi:hypothetical protein
MDDPRERIAAWGRRSRAARLERLAATPAALDRALADASTGALARRPEAGAWAPVEIVCHLRDVEESYFERLSLILASDEPRFPTTNPDRWAVERQYLRNEARAAAGAFAARRGQTFALFTGLEEEAWARAGWQMDSRGRRTVEDFLTVMAWHDENHLAQLARALEGRA